MNRTHILKSALIAGFSLAMATIAGGCGSSTPTSPGVQPQIINQGNGNFQFQITAMKGYSGALQYSFSNSATAADVNQSSAISAGNVTLSILDANGTSVYSQDLNKDGSFVTSTGTAGMWTIIVTPSSATGDLNFRVDSRP